MMTGRKCFAVSAAKMADGSLSAVTARADVIVTVNRLTWERIMFVEAPVIGQSMPTFLLIAEQFKECAFSDRVRALDTGPEDKEATSESH